jgi:hypothetical protein
MGAPIGQTRRMNLAEGWALANDTLQAVKWPVVVTVAVLGFRRQIGDRIRNLLRLKGSFGEAEFNPSAEAKQLTAQLSGVEKVIDASLVSQAITEDVEPLPMNGSPVLEVGPEIKLQEARPTLLDLRQDIEDIIRASWSSGFEAGNSGHYRSEPVPDIQWTGTVPEVTGWSAGLDILTDYGRKAAGMPPPPSDAAKGAVKKAALERRMRRNQLAVRINDLDEEIQRVRLRQTQLQVSSQSWALNKKILDQLQGEREAASAEYERLGGRQATL